MQREKAIGAAARIEQFVRQIEQQLTFAALPQLGAGGVEQRRIEFLKLLRMVPAVTDIAQIDAKGQEQLAVSRLSMDVAGANRDRSQEPAFRNAKPGQTWFGPVYFRKETEPYMSIAVRAGGAAGAVTVAEINLKFIWDVVTRIKIGKKGKAYVVDGTGHLVADPDIGLVLRKTDLAQLPQVKIRPRWGRRGVVRTVAQWIRGDFGAHRLRLDRPAGLEGVRRAALWPRCIETLNATILRTASLMLAGLLISALAALWLARSMVHPIRTCRKARRASARAIWNRTSKCGPATSSEALAGQFNR